MSRLEIFIKSLLHSKNCKIEEEGGTCDKVNCVRYKYSLEHFNSCERRLINKCSFCQEYTRLFRNHSKTCQQSDCSVPLCNDFKNDFKNELIKLGMFF